MKTIRDILEDLMIATANQYGGFDGFYDEDMAILDKAEAEIKALNE